MPSPQRVLLVHKTGHEDAGRLAGRIHQWLTDQGHLVSMREAASLDAVPPGSTDAVIVLGGDGTMLGVARMLVGQSVVLAGVNFGRVGFLTAADPENWRPVLESCLEGRAPMRECSVLAWTVRSEGRPPISGYAVNDVVLSHGAFSRVVNVDVRMDGVPLTSVRGDGVVVATPVGSSGYCISAGGPLLSPDLDVVVFVPICPFLSLAPPAVVPSDRTIVLELMKGSAECYLTVDGQEGQLLQVGDEVEVRSLPRALRIVGDDSHFFRRMRMYAAAQIPVDATGRESDEG
ncbi:MAG: NAD(+)/NADH kinase [Desulfovibrio sp.]|jgi:NAD+ kinase|nr:NAD(+)/NADH kinase [Desulfovibrio sp.]